MKAKMVNARRRPDQPTILHLLRWVRIRKSGERLPSPRSQTDYFIAAMASSMAV